MKQAESSAAKPDDGPPAGQLRGRDALAQAIVALIRAARREMRLFAPQLPAAVFGTDPVTACAGFLTHHPRNRLRVLVEDAAQVQRDNDRLLELARRLRDQLELRAVAETDRGARDLYLIVDRSALLVQADLAREDAVLTRSPGEAARFSERFDTAWERAEPVALRTLGL